MLLGQSPRSRRLNFEKVSPEVTLSTASLKKSDVFTFSTSGASSLPEISGSDSSDSEEKRSITADSKIYPDTSDDEDDEDDELTLFASLNYSHTACMSNDLIVN